MMTARPARWFLPLRRLTLAALLTLALPLPGLAREPLKPAPDSPLDQRILTRPGAILRDGPDAEAVKKPPVFTTYYVFAREDRGGTVWLELGADRTGAATGWMRAEDTVDWKQTIVAAFASPADRIPVLFFEDRGALERFVKDETMSTRAELLAQTVRAGGTVPGTGVIAAEPAEQVSITEQFYLLPILDAAEISVNRRKRRIVEVASINQEVRAEQPAAGETRPFRVGVVFVIDTSMSMDPYIDRTRQAVRDILAGLASDADKAQLSFGMVGFRSSLTETPALEYTVREFHPLQKDFDEAAFLAAVDAMKAATVSSHAFDEDGLSGLVAAAEMPGWADFDGRYIIYVTDAGMLVGADQGSAAGTTPQLFAARAQKDLGIATFALFLKTKAGRAYHEDALAQLATLTRLDSVATPLVFPIEDGSVEAFGDRVDQLTRALLDQVRQGEAAQTPPPDVCTANPDDITCAASQAGLAMRLAWLGRQEQAQAPDTYRAWAADFALDDPGRRALNARVLLTRNQLNDLYVTLQALVEAAAQAIDTDPTKFFSVLKTTLAHVVRDPTQLPALDPSARANVAPIDEFDDLGAVLGAYFADLPYDSDLGSITAEAWDGMTQSDRYEFLEGVKAKMSMYELYYADAANWVSINPDAGEGEKVYPVPLEMMP